MKLLIESAHPDTLGYLQFGKKFAESFKYALMSE